MGMKELYAQRKMALVRVHQSRFLFVNVFYCFHASKCRINLDAMVI